MNEWRIDHNTPVGSIIKHTQQACYVTHTHLLEPLLLFLRHKAQVGVRRPVVVLHAPVV